MFKPLLSVSQEREYLKIYDERYTGLWILFVAQAQETDEPAITASLSSRRRKASFKG